MEFLFMMYCCKDVANLKIAADFFIKKILTSQKKSKVNQEAEPIFVINENIKDIGEGCCSGCTNSFT